jgi:uncharacterized delta-60 repeat protein
MTPLKDKVACNLNLAQLEERSTPAVVGYPDQTFGFNGQQTVYGSHSSNYTRAIATAQATDVMPDGRIIIAGERPLNNDISDTRLIRLLPTGQIDRSFGGIGERAINFELGGNTTTRPIGVSALSDGRILTSLQVGIPGSNNAKVGLARLNPLGSYDPLYADGGRRLIDLPGKYTMLFGSSSAAAEATDGQYVVGVTLQSADNDWFWGILRVNADGNPDSTFGNNGWQLIPFAPLLSLSNTMADLEVASDGSIYVAGTTVTDSQSRFAVVKLNNTGIVDSSFGNNGTATYRFANTIPEARVSASALSLLPEGKLLVAGTVDTSSNTNNQDYDFGIVRLDANGQVDSTFGNKGDGSTIYGFNRGGANSDVLNAMAIQSDGRIVVAGSVDIANFTTNTNSYYSSIPSYFPTNTVSQSAFGTLRLTANGQVDRSFNFTGARIDTTTSYSNYGNVNRAIASNVVIQPDSRIVVVGSLESTYSYSYSYYHYYTPYYFTTRQLQIYRYVGSLEQPTDLTVGGVTTGDAVAYSPDSEFKYQPVKTFKPFPDAALDVRVARADFNADGIEDTAYVVGPGGGPLVRVVNGKTGQDLVPQQFAFEETFRGGLFVTAGDIDGDGRAELVLTPDQGGGPRVRVFTIFGGILTQRDDFFGIDDTSFRGGARAALGDLNGDGRPELIVGAGFGGGPRVAIYTGAGLLRGDANPQHLVQDFLPFLGDDASRLRNGVSVTAGDLNGDGYAEVIVGGGPGGAPRVLALDGASISIGDFETAILNPLTNFFVADDITSRGGVRVLARDVDGDNQADLVTASGEGELARVRVYRANTILNKSAAPPADQEFAPFDGIALASGVFVG